MSFFHGLLSIRSDFYVSSSGSGTGNGSLNTPFTGLQFKNLVDAGLPGIPHGARIRFNRGEIFDYQYDLDNGSVTIDAYGSGAQPQIRGSINIAGQTWTNAGDGTWYTAMAQVPYGVTIDGARQRQAQTDWIVTTAKTSTTTIAGNSTTLNSLNSAEALNDGNVGIVAKEFSFRPTFMRTITNYSSGTLTYNSAFQNNSAPGVGYGFKLFNHAGFASVAGDWAYYTTGAKAGRLYVKSAVNPNTLTIRAIVNNYGINIGSGVSNVSISNIDIREVRLECLYSVSNNNLTVNSCTFSQSMLNGCSFTGNSTNVTMTGCTVRYCNGNGIHIAGIGSSMFTLNTIHNIGISDNFGVLPQYLSVPYYTDVFRSVGCGIHSRWDITATRSVMDSVTIQYNDIYDVGYIGIAFTGTNNTVQYNLIDNFALAWNDGGGIYCISRPYGTGYACEDNLVYKNLVTNGIGNLDGITAESTIHAEGIYIDNASTTNTVDSNFVEEMPDYGIMVNFDTSFNTVTNNTVVDCAVACISFRQDTSFNYGPYNPDWSITFTNNNGNVCTGNIMACRSTSQVCVQAYSFNSDSNYNPFSNGGSTNNNHYLSPYRLNVCMHKASTEVLYSLDGSFSSNSWRTKMGGDAGSTALTNYCLYVDDATAEIDVKTTVNETGTDVTGNDPGANYADIYGNDVTTQTIPAYSGVINTVEFKLLDNFDGSSVGLASHTPDKGGPWTVHSGTISTNGSGVLTCSSAGEATVDISNGNATVTTFGRVTNTASNQNILCRYVDANNYIQVQLNYTTNNMLIISRVAGVNTTLATNSAGTLAINTDYTIKVKVRNNDVIVHFNNQLSVQVLANSTINTNHPSSVSTKHGIRMGTQTQIGYMAVVGGFS